MQRNRGVIRQQTSTGMTMYRYDHVPVWPCTDMTMYRYDHVPVWPCTDMTMYRYDHVPKSVNQSNEGKVTILWNQQCELIELFLTINWTSLSLIINKENTSYVYWTVHHLDSWVKRNQLDATYFIILFNAQHVSDVNTTTLKRNANTHRTRYNPWNNYELVAGSWRWSY